MKILLLLITILFSFSSFALAQGGDGTVKGRLVDTAAKQGLSDATVSVISSKDSSLITFTLSVKSGVFEIKSLEPGQYRLLVSFQGYQTLKKDFEISANKKNIEFGDLHMQKEYKTLKEVVVMDEAPVTVRGDTIGFKADAFKNKTQCYS